MDVRLLIRNGKLLGKSLVLASYQHRERVWGLWAGEPVWNWPDPRANMRSFTLVVLAVIAVTVPYVAVDGVAVRCGLLSFLGSDWSCRQSCKVLGHVSSPSNQIMFEN